MQIDFRMTGGYGGLFATRPLSCLVEAEELPEPARRALAALLDSAPASAGAGLATRPDVLVYHVSIIGGHEPRTWSWDDATAPAAVRPLLQSLQQCAIQRRGSA
jgi:hypothetical protein